MKILFIHQNFPGQFKHLAPALVAQGHQVIAFVMRKNAPAQWQGIRFISYHPTRGSAQNIHPWLSDFETKVIRAEAAYRAAIQLKAEGFTPDIIIAHPGWGESIFIKEVWPQAKLGIYCEFFYRPEGADTGFDPEFQSTDIGDACRLRLKNLNNFVHFSIADAGLSPTQWQASTFPEPFRNKITVVHDGIDTQLIAPNLNAKLTLGMQRQDQPQSQLTLTRQDEIITFVSRNLEPYRGYHIFMRALPQLLKRRPKARIFIVGSDGVSYGAKPPPGQTWKNIFLNEVKDQIDPADMARVSFVGQLPYPEFIGLLQLSSVHIYLTYPFVLSWSLLEAMSVGCAIVASNTTPLHEAIQNQETGYYVDFFDSQALTDRVVELLDNLEERQRLGKNAREFACQHYDLKTICLPKQLEWVAGLA